MNVMIINLQNMGMNKLFGLNSKCKNNNNVPKVKVEKEIFFFGFDHDVS